MKVLVPIKRVVDYHVHIRVLADQSDVDVAHAKMSINPFDEIALEAALQLKEQGHVTEIVVVSVGVVQAQEQLRTALALGADSAILVQSDQVLTPLWVAKVLQSLVVQEKPKIVLLGKQSIDGDNNQTGQMLAGLLQWSQGTFVSNIEVTPQGLVVTREVDQGLMTLALTLPAVVTTDLRLNVPRYPSLPNIMQAKRKNITTMTLAELAINPKTQQQVMRVAAPKKRTAGVRVENVAALVTRLREEAQVIS